MLNGKEEWLTPPVVIKAVGPFDLDPCAPINRPWDTAKKHLTINDDGLRAPWEGFVWCNPPYGPKTGDWLARMAEHNNGIALVFARTETRAFHRHVWRKACGIFFFSGRLSFFHVTGKQGGTAGAPSCLIAYGGFAMTRLRGQGMLAGHLVELTVEADHGSLPGHTQGTFTHVTNKGGLKPRQTHQLY